MPFDYCYKLVAACLPGGRVALSEPLLGTTSSLGDQAPSTVKPIRPSAPGNSLLDLVPLIWSNLSRAERLALRLCCREGRRVHDSLVSNLCICECTKVLAALPAFRLAVSTLPVCHDTSAELSRTLRGFVSRGCHPHSVLLCFDNINERRRLEQSLAVLLPLAAAPLELSDLHLAGVPLTAHTAHALEPLLTAIAAAAAASPPSADATAAGQSGFPFPALTTASAPPPPPPLRFFLYGYDLTRSPAPAVLESLTAAAALRLRRLELWGCVGWPPRLAASLQACSRLHGLCLSFQPLAAPLAAGGFGQSHQRSVSGAAGGALASFSLLAAAQTAAAAVRALGTLRQLRCLELRGAAFRPSATAAARTHGRPGRRGGGAKKAEAEASPEDAAEAVGLTPQSLACALFQLTGLTSLAVEGLRNPAPLMATLGAMRGLRRLELPDAFGQPAALAALARAAPRLEALTLGSVGHGPVLAMTDAEERAASAARRPPEPLSLPPALAALRVARFRPTLRTMRALQRALETRDSGAAAGGSGGGGGDVAGSVMAVAVPGIELDLPDVDFDPLQAFHRSEDGVMRSTLLPESAEALATAIALLQRPNSPAGGRSGRSPQLPDDDDDAGDGSGLRFGRGADAGPAAHGGEEGGEGGYPWVGGRWQQRELVIHNDFGSLAAAAPDLDAEDDPLLHLPRRSPQWPGAVPRSATAPPAGCVADGPVAAPGDGRSRLASCGGLTALYGRRAGHDVWIGAMAPLLLTALELYGIGLTRSDLSALAELTTLRRLTLAAAEISTEALPRLAALPRLEELELLRCMPRRRTPHIGRFSFTPATLGGGTGGGSAPHSRRVSFATVSIGGATSRSGGSSLADGGGGGAADAEGELFVDMGQRALLELCMSSPRLRRLHVVRCAGAGPGAGGVDGPLGAEWVRRQLAVLGPRHPTADGGVGCGGDEAASAAWPEVMWD